MTRIRRLAVSLAAVLPLLAEIRSVPPPGVPLPGADRSALELELSRLNARIEKLRAKTDRQLIQIINNELERGLHLALLPAEPHSAYDFFGDTDPDAEAEKAWFTSLAF